jgi:hypothetical protein
MKLLVRFQRFLAANWHLELQTGPKLFHCRLYPVPKQVFKDELQRLSDIGVLNR